MPPLLDSRRARLILCWGFLCLVLLVRLFVAGLHRHARPPQPFAIPVLIDLNRASMGELMALGGIGRTRAGAIVLHRVRHGPFRSIENLLEVDGIGEKTLAALRPLVLDPAISRQAMPAQRQEIQAR